MSVRVGQTMLSACMGVNSGEGRNAGIQQVHVTEVYDKRQDESGDRGGHEQRQRLNAVAYKRWDQNRGKNNIFRQWGSEIHGNYENTARTLGTSVLRESKETDVVVFVSKIIGLDRTDSMISEQCCSSPCDVEVANGCFGLGQGLVDLCESETSHRPEIHATLASPERKCPQKYYIRGTLKRLMGVLAWLKAGWIRRLTDVVACLRAWWIRVSVKQVTDQKSMLPLRLMGVLASLKAWWIRFGHGYYIRGTLKRLTDVVAWLKALWIRGSVKQVTDQKSMPLVPCWGGKL
ncbi:hypothetical protein C8R44DRAFT_744699 [Mycena epipterygia]|nr:hypothetical protein C8R44DRAFT_744699 [Mycena epipterygia]